MSRTSEDSEQHANTSDCTDETKTPLFHDDGRKRVRGHSSVKHDDGSAEVL